MRNCKGDNFTGILCCCHVDLMADVLYRLVTTAAIRQKVSNNNGSLWMVTIGYRLEYFWFKTIQKVTLLTQPYIVDKYIKMFCPNTNTISIFSISIVDLIKCHRFCCSNRWNACPNTDVNVVLSLVSRIFTFAESALWQWEIFL